MNEIIEQFLTYLQGIWRHRWYALGIAWLVCLGGWALVFKLPANMRHRHASIWIPKAWQSPFLSRNSGLPSTHGVV